MDKNNMLVEATEKQITDLIDWLGENDDRESLYDLLCDDRFSDYHLYIEEWLENKNSLTNELMESF